MGSSIPAAIAGQVVLMGRHIIAKTGNVAAVQRQLGHKNAAYSLQYARITEAELQAVVDAV